MEGDERLIALFPLHRVLFPGGALTLGVFEDRYRALLDDLEAAGGPQRFGVVLIQRGREVGAAPDLHRTGTVARIERRWADGGMIRLCLRGERRFVITGLETGRPYAQGWVRLLPEEDGDPDACQDLHARVQASFRAYLRHLQPTSRRRLIPEAPRELSYAVAQALRIPLSEKQRLLEAATTQERLEAEQEILRRERRFLLRFGQGSSTQRWGPFAVN